MKFFSFIFLKNPKQTLLVFCLFLIIASCTEDKVIDNPPVEDSAPWQEVLEKLDLNPSIIVENGTSIQSAVDVAEPGEVIYIAPGLYSEQVTITKDALTLIGLDGPNNEKVEIAIPGGGANSIQLGGSYEIEIFNIIHTNPNLETKKLAELENDKPNERRKSHSFEMVREDLDGNIAHYTFKIGFGDQPYEHLSIHRVVSEKSNFKPIKTIGEIFMIHGASQNFDDIFLTAGASEINAETSSPYYLASKGIDVWGIDLAWTNIPLETADFSFMEDWGVEKDVEQVLSSLSIARLIRGLSGQGFSRLNLLGFSYGGTVAYAAAGKETQQPKIFRDIKGLINADMVIKYAYDEIHRSYTCDQAEGIMMLISKGDFVNNNGAFFSVLGELAATKPGEKYVNPPFGGLGLSNSKLAIFLGANTYLPDNKGPAPFWHFAGGNQTNEMPFASDFVYTDTLRWIELLRSLPPYQPRLTGYEARACACGDIEVSIDDHFSEIKIPILYLSAAGGQGEQGLFSNTITNSSDVTAHIVSKKSAEERFTDFGHGDLFMAKSAPEDVWSVLEGWLKNH